MLKQARAEWVSYILNRRLFENAFEIHQRTSFSSTVKIQGKPFKNKRLSIR